MTPRRERQLWHRPGWWIACAVAGRHAVGLWQLRHTLARVDRPGLDTVTAEDVELHIVVPVLREQQHISAAVDWFSSLLHELPGSTLTFVSTARERRERDHLINRLAESSGQISLRRFPQLTSEESVELEAARRQSPRGILSRDVVAEILERSPLSEKVLAQELARPAIGALPIRHVHYQGDGRKAAQVNYAVEHLTEAEGLVYIAVYDIDSRPDPALLRRTAAFIKERARLDGEPPAVVQQSARFTTSGVSLRGWERALCRGAARLQTLWTLRREIPSFHRYARGTRKATGLALVDAAARGLVQTVGHGLFVRLDVFRQVGGLPTFTVLDDLPFGYRLTVEQVPVDCVPFTGRAPAPEDLRDLVAQGQRWFQNYLDYPRCAAVARSEKHGTEVGRVVALGVGCYRGAGWLLRSPSVLSCIVLLAGRSSPWQVRVAAAAALWLGVVAPVRLLAAAEGRPLSAREHGQQSLELLAAYLVSSLGPAVAIVQRIVSGPPDTVFAAKTHCRVTRGDR